MKKSSKLFIALMVLSITTIHIYAQKPYAYDTVPGDPNKVRIYTLSNGLRVYLTVYKDAPRIQTAIAVRTGSKNDPSDNTGLSHYLEHMMFKGSDEFGTKDFTKEKPLLDKIEYNFEVYKKTIDTLQRKKIYHEIDSLSGLAATYAIANEYDKLLAVIGAKGTNAFTSFEETVYINDIPSNKIDQWLQIERERFQDPVFRLFHTELETVYEEKNMSLDNDEDKVFEDLFAGLFQKNTYGTQTTIGSVEHLKNPSLVSLRNYFNARYVPNNMAIILSGDFNPDELIRQIDATFGQLASRPVIPYVPAVEAPIMQPIVKEVVGPDAESVTIGYRLGGVATRDADLVTIFNMVLSNSTAGLMDLNLNQAQKVLKASAFSYVLKDYSVNVFSGEAKEGQSLEEVKDLVMAQIEMVKKGEFPDWLIPAIISDIKLEEIKKYESNNGRAMELMSEFIKEIPHTDIVHNVERLSKITKQDIIDFANKNYRNNYVIVYKRTGPSPETIKVVKPPITPVTMNRDEESAFLKKIVAEPSKPIEPVFIDYAKDIQKLTLKNNIPVLYKANTENKTFDLYYFFEMGTNANRELGIALDYLKYLGSSKLSPKEIQEEFYKLGCSLKVNSSDVEVWVSLNGLSENMTRAVTLFESLLSDAQPNEPALENLVADIKKRRDDDKLSKQTILWQALYNYGVYGDKSPFTNILSSSELDALTAQNLVNLIHGLNAYQHKVLYYGPESPAALAAVLNKEHKVPAILKPVPVNRKFEQKPTDVSKIYTVDYNMKQAEIIMLSKSDPYDKGLVPVIRLFNEYFGGGMNSIVFQEIRESKGLAYSAYAGYRQPAQPYLNNYLFSYIGTQIDKLPEAMKTMMGIFNNMPESEKALNSAKEAIINKIRTERITKAQVLFNYINAQKFGLTYDIRRDIFEKVPMMKFSDLKAFQQKYIRDKKYHIMVLGKKSDLDVKTLSNYGEVNELQLKDAFGY
ncbi:MAG: insulinase family protein [Bacteroidales bacterium]|jgi:predicted Zn-dependent peptidase|nr:insulinase family protein [Bacteroidales bacterium]